jgi:putative transcriptional regulator
MTKILNLMSEAIQHVRTGPDVSEIRGRLGMSRETFAQKFGFSLTSVRSWETGKRSPRTFELVLLRLLEREPDAVLRALET